MSDVAETQCNRLYSHYKCDGSSCPNKGNASKATEDTSRVSDLVCQLSKCKGGN